MKCTGKVTSLAQSTGAEFAVLPPQNATGNWVKVVQRIPVRTSVECREGDPPLRVGMSTTIEIDTGHKRTFGDILKASGSDHGFPDASVALAHDHERAETLAVPEAVTMTADSCAAAAGSPSWS